jgi:hypothetical protein
MLYLRVVKGAVNFIVTPLGSGIDAGDRLILCGPFPLRTSKGFRSNPSHKGKESCLVRAAGKGVGSRPGSPPSPEAMVWDIFTSLGPAS